MHNHLALVKASHCTPKIENETPHLSDMDIIIYQALLMEAGGITFKAFKSGEIADILTGLVALAYAALQALVQQDEDMGMPTVERHQEYQMLAIMRLLSDKIQHCSSGNGTDYCELYYLCASLAIGFLNADFDKAFQVYCEWRTTNRDYNEDYYKANLPDLTDCLYE